MKERVATGIIWVFLAFVTIASLRGYINVQKDNKRLLYDLKAANEKAVTFTTRDGHQGSKLIAQNLTVQEFKKVNPATVEKLKNMYIRPAQVEAYTETSQTMSAEISAPVKDSIPDKIQYTVGNIEKEPIEPIEPIRIKTFSYTDKWLKVKGVLIRDSASLKLAATDTIFTAIYKGERRHRWAWILSKRQLTVSATNRNPYIKINVIQSVVIKN